MKGVASLALFLGFGLHSSFSSFLLLLSCTCLEKWKGQGPDMRPSALGLYFLVGLGDQPLLPVCPLSSGGPVETDTSVCLLLCKSVEFVLGHLVGGGGICSKASSRWMKSRGPWLLLSGL